MHVKESCCLCISWLFVVHGCVWFGEARSHSARGFDSQLEKNSCKGAKSGSRV